MFWAVQPLSNFNTHAHVARCHNVTTTSAYGAVQRVLAFWRAYGAIASEAGVWANSPAHRVIR